MTKEKEVKFRRVYGISLAVLSVIVGVLFIVQTWRIYSSAEQSPYTAEIISKMFGQIALPFVLWIIAIIGGGVVFYRFPEEKKRPKAYVELETTLKRTEKRLPISEAYILKISDVKNKEEGLRKSLRIGGVALSIVIACVCAGIIFGWIYLPMIKSEFFAAHEGLVDKLFQIGVLLVMTFILLGFLGIWADNSRKRQQKSYLEILSSAKGQPKTEGKATEKSKPKALLEKINLLEKLSKENKKKVVFGTRIALGVIGVVFVVWGIVNGGMNDILMKAINICTQCIGLG